MTQLIFAKKKKITPLMKRVADKEHVDPEFVMDKISKGRIVIPNNAKHDVILPCGIGCASTERDRTLLCRVEGQRLPVAGYCVRLPCGASNAGQNYHTGGARQPQKCYRLSEGDDGAARGLAWRAASLKIPRKINTSR